MTRRLTDLSLVRNPFQFGRGLDESELVDRERELEMIEHAITNRGKFFLMGPRRFGKTSILSAVERRVSARGATVLRYDAEAYETTALLAQALLTGAARKLAGPLDRVIPYAASSGGCGPKSITTSVSNAFRSRSARPSVRCRCRS